MAAPKPKFSVQFEGMEKLSARFNSLNKKMQSKILSPALKEGAKVISSKSKSEAPVGLTGDLRKTIHVRRGNRSRRRIEWHVRSGTRAKLKIPVNSKWYYPAHVEYGTENSNGIHYMRKGLVKGRGEANLAIAIRARYRLNGFFKA